MDVYFQCQADSSPGENMLPEGLYHIFPGGAQAEAKESVFCDLETAVLPRQKRAVRREKSPEPLEGAKAMKRTEEILIGTVCAVLALLFLYLTCYGMLFTSVIEEEDYISEPIAQKADWILVSLLEMAAAAALLYLFGKVEKRIPLRWMTFAALVWAFAAAVVWIVAVRTEPRADAEFICYAARQALGGNYSALRKWDGYIHRCPHQLGYMALSQLLQTILGAQRYPALQCCNAVFLALAYGGALRLVAAGALCGLAVLIKPNGWIPVVAMTILGFLWLLVEKQWKRMPLLVLLVAFPLLFTNGARLLYEAKTGADLESGTPMTAYLAMGLQESSRAPGWYNEYVDRVYEDAEGRPERVSARAKRNIADRLETFASDPAYAASFFHEKMVSQWNETTFEAIWISRTCPYVEKARTELGRQGLHGWLRDGLEQWMEGYTLALYACFALGLFRLARALLLKREELSRSLLLGLSLCAVTMTGAFLYHMIFKAKSQYLFIYLLTMIPVAAWGVEGVFAGAFRKPRLS